MSKVSGCMRPPFSKLAQGPLTAYHGPQREGNGIGSIARNSRAYNRREAIRFEPGGSDTNDQCGALDFLPGNQSQEVVISADESSNADIN